MFAEHISAKYVYGEYTCADLPSAMLYIHALPRSHTPRSQAIQESPASIVGTMQQANWFAILSYTHTYVYEYVYVYVYACECCLFFIVCPKRKPEPSWVPWAGPSEAPFP